MPLLGKLLGALFTMLFGFFFKFFSLQTAFRIAMMLSMTVLLGGLFMALRSCVSGVCGQAIFSLGVIHIYFGMGLGMIFNSITYAAASCYISVWMICQMYVIKKKMITMVSGG